ncbi:MAG: hypothetical protein M0R77_10875 [Gammaproteobacteria bacterium]|nr:hypothetical protein [Gammaproteobacteria bacterium]
MWTIYDVYRDRYWNDQRQCWCAVEEATRYSLDERNHFRLSSVSFQWRYVEPHAHLSESEVLCW